MSDIVSRRQRTPWFWPDFIYNCFGEGREHDKTLKILHSFTQKVSDQWLIQWSKNPWNIVHDAEFKQKKPNILP